MQPYQLGHSVSPFSLVMLAYKAIKRRLNTTNVFMVKHSIYYINMISYHPTITSEIAKFKSSFVKT